MRDGFECRPVQPKHQMSSPPPRSPAPLFDHKIMNIVYYKRDQLPCDMNEQFTKQYNKHNIQ